jgi:hypothetical protein
MSMIFFHCLPFYSFANDLYHNNEVHRITVHQRQDVQEAVQHLSNIYTKEARHDGEKNLALNP